MTASELRAEADSILEARRILLAVVPQGFYVQRESVLCNQATATIKGSGETVEQATSEAEAQLPPHVTVTERTVSVPEERYVFIRAVEEKEAANLVRPQLGRQEYVVQTTLDRPGRQGVLGIGRRLNEYQLLLRTRASIELVFRPWVNIAVSIAPRSIQCPPNVEPWAAAIGTARAIVSLLIIPPVASAIEDYLRIRRMLHQAGGLEGVARMTSRMLADAADVTAIVGKRRAMDAALSPVLAIVGPKVNDHLLASVGLNMGQVIDGGVLNLGEAFDDVQNRAFAASDAEARRFLGVGDARRLADGLYSHRVDELWAHAKARVLLDLSVREDDDPAWRACYDAALASLEHAKTVASEHTMLVFSVLESKARDRAE
jgi:hypothetical protein